MKSTVIGLDLAKTVFHYVNVDASGKPLGKRELSRTQMIRHFSNMEPSRIAMEACGSSHYWARTLTAMGHTAELLPPQFVKPYLRGQKNDFNDAKAIGLASIAGGIRPVEIKSEAQQIDIAYQTARSLVSRQRTAQGNHIRGLLAEFGIAVRTGFKPLREKLCELTDVGSTLAPRLKSLLADEYEHLCELDQRLEWHDREVKRTAKESVRCQALIEMPGIGPVVSVALVNWFGDAKQYKRGRDAAAALGLVPSQHSSGGKSRLGKISKRGDSFTRCQIVHGARAAVRAAANKDDNLSRWIQALVERRGVNKATVALANKLVRIAWAILATGCCYEQKLAAKV